jgi:hypothetical protein
MDNGAIEMFKGDNIMKNRSDEEAYSVLYSKGFTVLEISRLIKLHQDYTAGKFDQDALVHASYVSQSEQKSIINKVFALLGFNGRSCPVYS